MEKIHQKLWLDTNSTMEKTKRNRERSRQYYQDKEMLQKVGRDWYRELSGEEKSIWEIDIAVSLKKKDKN